MLLPSDPREPGTRMLRLEALSAERVYVAQRPRPLSPAVRDRPMQGSPQKVNVKKHVGSEET